MAELKHERRDTAADEHADVLHGLSAVAELKPRDDAGGEAAQGRVLHGLSAVAELKPGVRAGVLRAFDGFSTASAPWPN